jgi:hypothetical protein
MAECDSGYRCRICGVPVDEIIESELYLRYVLCDVQIDQLADTPEAHVWCNGNLAQFIVDPAFDHPIKVDPEHDKSAMDDATRRLVESVVTRAWKRLQWLPESGLDVTRYPLEDVVPPDDPEESLKVSTRLGDSTRLDDAERRS